LEQEASFDSAQDALPLLGHLARAGLIDFTHAAFTINARETMGNSGTEATMHIQNWFYQLTSTTGRGLFFVFMGIVCIACAASTPIAPPLEVKGGGEFRIGINAEP
jgi:hypothetical protein